MLVKSTLAEEAAVPRSTLGSIEEISLLRNALEKLTPLLKSKAGSEVSPLDCHALVKSTLFAAVPSFAPAGNDVRAVQPFHADVKLAPLLISSAGKDVRAEEFCHALVKLVPFLASIAGKDVREGQLRHADVKLLPLLMSSAGNDVSDELLYHALSKDITLLVSSAGKDVREVQSRHARAMLFTPDTLTLLNSTISLRERQNLYRLAEVVPSDAPLSIKSFRAASISLPLAVSGKSMMP